MLKEIFLKKSLTVNNAIITLGDTDDTGKGRHFKSRFIQPGVAGYPGQFGNVLITKESLDKFIKTMVGVPVIINHKDLNKKNADEERVGVVNSVWYDNKDGWYWCDGIIWDETAQNLITDKNWSVSCSYDVITADNKGGSENNIKYDIEFLDGVFTHLALVSNPRYERANIVFNSKTEVLNDKWITIKPNGEENKGRHLLLKDGESVEDAMHRNGWYNKRQASEEWENKYRGSKKQREFYNTKINELSVALLDNDKEKAEYLKGLTSILSRKRDINYINKQKEIFENIKKQDKDLYNEPLIQGQIEALKMLEDDSFEDISFEEWEDKQKDDLEKNIYKERSEKDKKADERKHEQKQKLRDYYYNHPQELTKEKAEEHWNKEKIDLFDLHEELNKQSDTKEDKKEKYKLKENSKITQKRFDNLFDNGSYLENHQFRKTIVLDNIHQVEFDKKRGFITFYEQGDLSEEKDYSSAPKGTLAMLPKFRTDDYNKLVDYLFENNEEWRLERNKAQNSMTNTIKQADNSKETDMALIEELKKLITKVENEKGDDMDDKEKIENEKVDKRKLIDEVGGILKGKVDDEIIRTIMKKMEEASYEDSEKSADNKKAKNEKEEDDAKNCKVKNEDIEDKDKVAELKEDEKKDVENKCKNSVENAKGGFLDKMNEIYNSTKSYEQSVEYVSRDAKIQAANDYFAK